MTSLRNTAWCWCVLLTISSVSMAQDLGRHDWSSSRVAIGQVQHDMSTEVRLLGQRLAETNATRFSGVRTVDRLAETLNRIGINTVLDLNSLSDENVDPSDDKLRIQSANVSLGQGMAVALREMNLGWTISKRDGAVMIAAQSRIEEELMTVTYDVTHLCATADVEEPLIDVITSSVDPDSWDDFGGPASLRPIAVRGRVLLVVSNEYHTHVDLLGILNSIRRMGGNGPFLNLRRANSSNRLNSNLLRSASSVGSSTPVAMPAAAKKRGIALPDSGSQGPFGGFGGGMGGGMVGGMF